MKNLMMMTGGILLLCILITSRTASPESAALTEPDENSGTVVSSLSSDAPERSAAEEIYWLREFEKKLAVFPAGSDKPSYISEVYVSTLPKADRKKLAEGIEVSGQKELNRLLEDYCS